MGGVERRRGGAARAGGRSRGGKGEKEEEGQQEKAGGDGGNLRLQIMRRPKPLRGKSRGKTPLKDLGAAHNLTSKNCAR